MATLKEEPATARVQQQGSPRPSNRGPASKEEATRGTAVSVALGLLAAVLGAMLYGTSSVASDNQQLLSGLGLMLLVVGGLMFGLGVLVELFSIRPALRQLASLHTRMGDPDSTQAAPPCAKAGGAAKSD